MSEDKFFNYQLKHGVLVKWGGVTIKKDIGNTNPFEAEGKKDIKKKKTLRQLE